MFAALPPKVEHFRAWIGVFAEDVNNEQDMAYVILHDFDPGLRWGPCRWMPRGSSAADMPQKGDQVLVVFDNYKDLWVVAWWPK